MPDAPQLRLCQVALASTDPPRLVAFYRDILGLPVLFDTAGMTFFQTGSARLMIGPAQPGQSVGGDAVVYLEPEDWRATEARLERAGIQFLSPPAILQRAEGRELALRAFRDPEGHALAIMGWRPAS